MYTNRAARHSHGNSRFQNQRRNFGNRNSRPARRQADIDVSLFVNKAQEVAPEEAYIPKHSFSDFAIADQLKQNIFAHGYTTPSPIQDQTIPPILEGKDVVGIANTGTGKTAAFLIPLINKVFLNRSQKILIVAPTRELALQIEEEFVAFAKNLNIYSTLCIGGVSSQAQLQSLRRNPNFVVGTPGRLKDLIQNTNFNLSACNNIVLDEVDRMMDMGFIQDVRFLISQLALKRQSLFFSATVSPEIISVMHTFLKNPVTISVKKRETTSQVDQDIIKVNGGQKIDILQNLLNQPDFKKVLVFGRTKHGVEKLSRKLTKNGYKAAAIHGNKSQGQRQRALEAFKKNQIQVLLATDVAARGLDIDDVSHVINYDIPGTYEDYVHRIGRTGRADKKGKALTFVD